MKYQCEVCEVIYCTGQGALTCERQHRTENCKLAGHSVTYTYDSGALMRSCNVCQASAEIELSQFDLADLWARKTAGDAR